MESYHVQLVNRFMQHLGCLVSQVSIRGAMEAIAPDLVLLPLFFFDWFTSVMFILFIFGSVR